MLFVSLLVRVFEIKRDVQPGFVVASLFNDLHRCACALLARHRQLRGCRCGDVGRHLFVRGGLHSHKSGLGA